MDNIEVKLKKNLAELTNCSVEEYKSIPKLPLHVLLDNVRSMQNVGSLLRTSDAFLVDEVIMAGITGTPPHKEISKTSLGAEDSVTWRSVDDAFEECVRLQASGCKICVLEQVHGSIDLSVFSAKKGEVYVLVVGNEVNGVDSRIVEIADIVLEIPMHGVKHSLNVAVSGGIALWKMAEEIGGKNK